MYLLRTRIVLKYRNPYLISSFADEVYLQHRIIHQSSVPASRWSIGGRSTLRRVPAAAAERVSNGSVDRIR